MKPTSEYIRMCEKAPELQKQWQPDAGDFISQDGVVLTLGTPWYREGQDIVFCWQGNLRRRVSGKDLIWLPRQDQYWEMLPKNILYCLNTTKDQIYKLHTLRRQWSGGDIGPLLLQAYMFSVHNKSWNGKEWPDAARNPSRST